MSHQLQQSNEPVEAVAVEFDEIQMGEQTGFDPDTDDQWTMWRASKADFDTLFSAVRGVIEGLNKINEMIENGEFGSSGSTTPSPGPDADGCPCCCRCKYYEAADGEGDQ